VFVGTYSIDRSGFGVSVVVFLALLGYLFKVLDIPTAPLILGFVLGPLMEENLRRALSLTHGSLSRFFERPISLTLLILIGLLLLWPLARMLFRRRTGQRSIVARMRGDNG